MFTLELKKLSAKMLKCFHVQCESSFVKNEKALIIEKQNRENKEKNYLPVYFV